jgi:hypothetical protein
VWERTGSHRNAFVIVFAVVAYLQNMVQHTAELGVITHEHANRAGQ